MVQKEILVMKKRMVAQEGAIFNIISETNYHQMEGGDSW